MLLFYLAATRVFPPGRQERAGITHSNKRQIVSLWNTPSCSFYLGTRDPHFNPNVVDSKDKTLKSIFYSTRTCVRTSSKMIHENTVMSSLLKGFNIFETSIWLDFTHSKGAFFSKSVLKNIHLHESQKYILRQPPQPSNA